MKTLLFIALGAFLPNIASAWEIITERENDGRVFTVAEQVGDAGAFLRLVCFEQVVHVEIVYPAGLDAIQDAVELLQVDNRPERIFAGFIDRIDHSTSVFVGLDRRDRPAASTKGLLKEVAAGNYLYLGDPDRTEAIDRWALKGSKSAIRKIQQQCS